MGWVLNVQVAAVHVIEDLIIHLRGHGAGEACSPKSGETGLPVLLLEVAPCGATPDSLTLPLAL